jgi:hypothetical protein
VYDSDTVPAHGGMDAPERRTPPWQAAEKGPTLLPAAKAAAGGALARAGARCGVHPGTPHSAHRAPPCIWTFLSSLRDTDSWPACWGRLLKRAQHFSPLPRGQRAGRWRARTISRCRRCGSGGAAAYRPSHSAFRNLPAGRQAGPHSAMGGTALHLDLLVRRRRACPPLAGLSAPGGFEQPGQERVFQQPVGRRPAGSPAPLRPLPLTGRREGGVGACCAPLIRPAERRASRGVSDEHEEQGAIREPGPVAAVAKKVLWTR